MAVFRKKRWWLLLLLTVLLLINTNFFWKLIYPISYKDVIWDIAEQYEQDPNLIAAIIMVESRYDKQSISSKGAVGLMQLMPKTATWAAEINRISYTEMEELAKPEINIQLGTWYVKYLQQKYDHQLPLVLASYNSGPTRVDEWLVQQTWDGRLETIDQIPFGETRHYVQKVVHFYERYQKIYD